mgnify:CR=1 FL=1
MLFRKNIRKFNRKKLILVVVLLLLAIISTINFDYYVSADNDVSQEDLSKSVFEILDDVDLTEMQNMVDNLDDIGLFEITIKDKISKILRGEYFTDYTSLTSAIISLIFGDIRSILPFVFTLIAIGILCNLINNMRPDNKSINDTINFVFLTVTMLIVIIAFKNILSSTRNTINLIMSQMQIIFPILITLLASIGSIASISIYNPLVAILTGVVSIVFNNFLYPLFIVIFILAILGNLTDTVKLGKLSGFLMSTFKWTIGIVFTIFTGFLSVQGISAGKYDSVSIKATKFAMKSYIPIIGSYVSDGMDFLILGSVLVKNSIGLIGVIILFITILSPILMIILYKLALQLSSGILEMTGNAKISNFLSSCSKLLILPIVLIIGIAFMYVITICLIMCTANIF